MRVNPWVCFDNTFLLVVSQVSGKRKAPGVKGTESLTCAREGIRTPNLLIRSQMLYPLSYARLLNCVLRMRILHVNHAPEKLAKSEPKSVLFKAYPRHDWLSGRPSA